MTDAEKAFERIIKAVTLTTGGTFHAPEDAEIVRATLKDHEKDKQFCISAQMHTLRLIDKAHALVKALNQVRTDAAIDHDGLPPTQIMRNLLGFIEDTATKALAEFAKMES